MKRFMSIALVLAMVLSLALLGCARDNTDDPNAGNQNPNADNPQVPDDPGASTPNPDSNVTPDNSADLNVLKPVKIVKWITPGKEFTGSYEQNGVEKTITVAIDDVTELFDAMNAKIDQWSDDLFMENSSVEVHYGLSDGVTLPDRITAARLVMVGEK